jgi:hypothetical protein
VCHPGVCESCVWVVRSAYDSRSSGETSLVVGAAEPIHTGRGAFLCPAARKECGQACSNGKGRLGHGFKGTRVRLGGCARECGR